MTNRTWTPIPCSCNNPGCTRWDIRPEGGTPVGPFTREDAVRLAASWDLLAVLEAVVISEQLDKRHDMMARAAIAKAKGGA